MENECYEPEVDEEQPEAEVSSPKVTKKHKETEKRKRQSDRTDVQENGKLEPIPQHQRNKVTPVTFDIDEGSCDARKVKRPPEHAVDGFEAQFIELCQNKQHQEVERILRSLPSDAAKALANTYDRFRPLHKAARYAYKPGALETVKLLVQYGADVNGLDNENQTPLHYASCMNFVTNDQGGDAKVSPTIHNSVVHFLASRGANVNAGDKNGYTPLAKAIMRCHSLVIRDLLLLSDCDVNKANSSGMQPLHFAAFVKNMEALQLLLQRKADVLSLDSNRRTAVHYLTWQTGNTNMLTEILTWAEQHGCKHKILSMKDIDDKTPLHLAVESRSDPVIRLLISHGVDVNEKTGTNSSTALHIAASTGDTDIVQLLLKLGADENLTDAQGQNALHTAAAANHPDVIKLLMGKSGNEWNLLHFAAERGWDETCAVLLYNVDINGRQGKARTALHLASMKNHVKVIELLLRSGAEVTLLDDDGKNCLELAIEHGSRDAAKLLLESDKALKMLRKCTPDTTTGGIDTPLRLLIRDMSELAAVALKSCMVRQDSSDNITYNYELIDDLYTNYSTEHKEVYDKEGRVLKTATPYTHDSSLVHKNHPFTLMVKHGCKELLKSEIVSSCIDLKWSKFGLLLYMLNTLGYLAFLVCFTTYVLILKSPYSYFDETMANCTVDSCSSIVNYCVDGEPDAVAAAAPLQYITLVLCSIFIFREVIQIFILKLRYISRDFMQWILICMQWLLYIFSILTVINVTACVRQHPSIREPWQWQLASVAILFGWVELLLYVRKLPHFGLYVFMLTDVLWSFLQFSPVYSILGIGFSLSFHMVFGNQARFGHTSYSMVSTLILMVGEMDYQNIFFGAEDAERGTAEFAETTRYYKFASYFLFIMFVVVMTIITMNLLVGLAVDDVKGVKEEAEIKRLAMLAELSLHIESLIPVRFRCRFVWRDRTIPLNGGALLLQKISKFLKPKQNTTDDRQEELLQSLVQRQLAVEQRLDKMALWFNKLVDVQRKVVQIAEKQDA